MLSDVDISFSLNMQTAGCSISILSVRLAGKILSILRNCFTRALSLEFIRRPRIAAGRGAVRSSFFSQSSPWYTRKLFLSLYPRFYANRHVHFSGHFSAQTDTWLLYSSRRIINTSRISKRWQAQTCKTNRRIDSSKENRNSAFARSIVLLKFGGGGGGGDASLTAVKTWPLFWNYVPEEKLRYARLVG